MMMMMMLRRRRTTSTFNDEIIDSYELETTEWDTNNCCGVAHKDCTDSNNRQGSYMFTTILFTLCQRDDGDDDGGIITTATTNNAHTGEEEEEEEEEQYPQRKEDNEDEEEEVVVTFIVNRFKLLNEDTHKETMIMKLKDKKK